MNRDEHKAFIRSSLIDIMRDVVYSINMLGYGMEGFAVYEYLLHSLFLQMTGAQEQKMKCICWELATDNLDYRFERYYKGWSLNECSTLKNKSNVYEDLVDVIKSHDSQYKIFKDEIEKKQFRDNTFNQIIKLFDNTNIAKFQTQKYDSFKKWAQELDVENIVPDDKNIFNNITKKAPITSSKSDKDMSFIYTLLYKHRNRCAHNTTSYQLNLPTLYNLRDEIYQKFDNVFMFFATLLLIDEIFRKLFEKYESLPRFI